MSKYVSHNLRQHDRTEVPMRSTQHCLFVMRSVLYTVELLSFDVTRVQYIGIIECKSLEHKMFNLQVLYN